MVPARERGESVLGCGAWAVRLIVVKQRSQAAVVRNAWDLDRTSDE